MPGSPEKQPKKADIIATFVQNLAKIFFVAEDERKTHDLIVKLGKQFLKTFGPKRGIRAIIFDFENEDSYTVVHTEDYSPNTTVFWSKLVAWALRRLQDPLRISEEEKEALMILHFQRRLEECCGVTKLIPPEIADY